MKFISQAKARVLQQYNRLGQKHEKLKQQVATTEGEFWQTMWDIQWADYNIYFIYSRLVKCFAAENNTQEEVVTWLSRGIKAAQLLKRFKLIFRSKLHIGVEDGSTFTQVAARINAMPEDSDDTFMKKVQFAIDCIRQLRSRLIKKAEELGKKRQTARFHIKVIVKEIKLFDDQKFPKIFPQGIEKQCYHDKDFWDKILKENKEKKKAHEVLGAVLKNFINIAADQNALVNWKMYTLR